MISDDTIVSLSSSPGPAARIIVRLSGASAFGIASKICDRPPSHASASQVTIRLATLQFSATIYFFISPKSYTGEDLLEFHLPCNQILCDRLILTCIAHGARPAEPGEFTARAFFNGKMDLTQAEGVAATIAALNQNELTAARQLMAGELAKRIAPIMELIAETLALIEAGIDFVDEEISFIAPPEIANRLDTTEKMLRDLMDQSRRFLPVGTEPTAILVGRPNAGKSTLLNALAGFNRAIVSPVAGTTRDALSAEVALTHGMIRMVDVAGIDQSVNRTLIDQHMQAQATRAIESADIIISVQAANDSRPPVQIGRQADLHVRTKSDLTQEKFPAEIAVSAISGAGLPNLREALDHLAFGKLGTGATLTLNTRHLQAIHETLAALSRAKSDADAGHELLAMHLREALDYLGGIIGTISPDELLGKIFSKFCIGK